jgi:hypothetical protein
MTETAPDGVATDEAFRYGFIRHAPGDPPNGFFQDLVAARPQGGDPRLLALRFIDGQEPYAGDFIPRLGDLAGPIRDFPRAAQALRRGAAAGPANWAKAVGAELDALLARHDQAPGYFASTGYREAVDRIWWSYFALVIVSEPAQALLAELTSSLWLAHVVDLALAPGVSESGGVAVVDLNREQIARLAEATIVLPGEIFPLPPPSDGAADIRASAPTTA